ncbi:hypothetical protein MUY14_34685 [Amycolatopsis sp. FBCC-B4732]|uniref:hypothetical protein n=1 Tax=Amycolatopsis sp. FBCC-B4732 TaxID=3079339 RepID=UPI001FF2780F|nr:hypothetical protein [Amycolatopsis sp. FBCC-B4732]UOX86855.1 hypothetical protein MUY14_34685 [Amycolatopsis sp. FBCC-B4732]
MLVVVQLPLVDLRLLAAFPTGRLASPHWPDPVSDDEFVRDAGPIRDRRRGGISDWSGERAFCDAKNFVRFVDAEPPALRDGTRITPVFRRLYSSGVSARLDFGFDVDDRRRARLTEDMLRDIARDCLAVKVRTAPAGAGRPLGDSGKALARRFLEVSTAKSFGTAAPGDLVAGGLPAVLAEPAAHLFGDLSSRRFDSTSVNGYQVESGAKIVPVWSVVTGVVADRARARQIRGNLWRLHAERESLRGVIRAWNSAPEIFSEEKLKSFLAAQLKILVPKERGGFDQSSALAFAGNCEELASPAVLRGLRSELLGQSKGILKSLDLLIERTARLPESTIRNHIRITYVDKRDMSSNDKYEISAPVSNSVIGRDNKVEGNTWTVGGKEDALRELAEAIELMKPRLDADEAAELDEAHAVIADGKSEPGLLKKAAKKILGVATFAGEVGAPVVEAVRKVLAALGLA